jgi:hypothetical protein
VRVDIATSARGFTYALAPDPEDPRHGRRNFRGVAEDPIELVRTSYRVDVPPLFSGIHPDRHAAAIWYALRPFVAARLTLPFGVSPGFQRTMAEAHGVAVAPVDAALAPPAPPREPRPCLLFSGGMDSTAASLILPAEAVVLFLDRIPHFEGHDAASEYLLELTEARAMCRRLQRHGRDVFALVDEHEWLMRPYPTWHSDMSLLAPLYLGDTFGAHVIETGDVLCAVAWRGYHDGSTDRWTCDPGALRAYTASPAAPPAAGGAPGQPAPREVSPAHLRDLAYLGLARGGVTLGLSEVATAILVAHSPFKDQTASCYYHASPALPGTSYCLQCDKCFRKLLLTRIAEDREVPAALIDGFLGHPRLRALFRRRFLDWHHIWFYIFQRLKCRHPFVAALQRQAQQGPDLGLLERWYAPAGALIDAAYREHVIARIGAHVATMTPDEARGLEELSVPPLDADLA